MFAAPTAPADFQLLTKYNSLTWKDKIMFLESLNDQLATYPDPEKIEICFIEFLHEKNVNVLLKVVKLFQNYIAIFGIRYLSFRQLTQVLLNCWSIPQFPGQELVVILYESVDEEEHKELVMVGLEDSLEHSQKNCVYALKIWLRLIKSKQNKQLLSKPQTLQNTFKKYLLTPSDQVINLMLEFMKQLSDIVGANATVLARKVGLPKVGLLNEYIAHKKFEEKYQNIEIKYIYDLSSHQWIQDYQYIPMKIIALSLRNAAEGNQSLILTKQLLISFRCLSQKKISNICNYIYALIVLNIHRQRSYSNNCQQLFEIFLYVLNTKKISRHFEELSEATCNSTELEYHEELWLNTVTESRLLERIIESSQQDEYNRFILLCGILKRIRKQSISIYCKEMLKKNNLNLMYRIKLQSLIKSQEEANL